MQNYPAVVLWQKMNARFLYKVNFIKEFKHSLSQ